LTHLLLLLLLLLFDAPRPVRLPCHAAVCAALAERSHAN